MRYFYAPGSYAATDAATRAIDAPPPVAAPRYRVLTSARPYDPATPGTPGGVTGLVELAAAAGGRCRVTFALAEDGGDGSLIASLAVRLTGPAVHGFAVYTRRVREGASGWTAGSVMLWGEGGPRPANIGQLQAALRGVPYVPPPPREAPWRACCVACRAEVSVTRDGKIFASHKCRTTTGVEGRS